MAARMWQPRYQGAASSPPGPPPTLLPGSGSAPSTGTPLPPTQAPHASVAEIAEAVKQKLVVPRPRMRSVTTSLIRLDQNSSNPILGASGRARMIVVNGGAVELSAGRSTSLLQLFDGNTDTVATAWFDAYGGSPSVNGDQPLLWLPDLDMPFINCAVLNVTVQNNHFTAASYFWLTMYYESIPIGERF
jgi:hypothetical protein